jgi:Uma2 family endonuclease
VEEDNAFFYPDVFVTCAAADRAQSHYKSAPSLVVEVLSPSTSAYDRGAKFAAYRRLPGLREYVLIDSERLSVDLFRRDDAGRWVLYPFDAVDQQVEFASVSLQLPLQALYEDVALAHTSAHP